MPAFPTGIHNRTTRNHDMLCTLLKSMNRHPSHCYHSCLHPLTCSTRPCHSPTTFAITLHVHTDSLSLPSVMSDLSWSMDLLLSPAQIQQLTPLSPAAYREAGHGASEPLWVGCLWFYPTQPLLVGHQQILKYCLLSKLPMSKTHIPVPSLDYSIASAKCCMTGILSLIVQTDWIMAHNFRLP